MQTIIYKTDSQLIREYVESKSQAAFAELAVRHASWVYSCALRQVRDPHLAEDVAQAVFIILARKAPKLAENTTLNAWLFQVTRYAAGHALRAGARRQRHERTAASMAPETSTTVADSNWQQIEPSLDELVARLPQEDRQAVLLRFYQQKTMADVGAALNVSEDAAKKRVARAVDRLRNMLRRDGVTIPAAGFATALIAGTTHTAPASVLMSCAAASVPPTSLAALVIAKKTISAMFITKFKLAVAAVLLITLIPVAGVGTYLLYKESNSPPVMSTAPAAIVTSDDSPDSQSGLSDLQGTWNSTSLMMNGGKAEPKYEKSTLVVAGEKATLFNSQESQTVVLKLYPATTPPRIDFIQEGKVSPGIFLLVNGHLKICWSMADGPRPGEFVTHRGDNRRLAEFDRAATAAALQGNEMIEILQGTWTSISVSTKGADASPKEQHGSVIIAGSTVNETGSPASHARALTVDPSHIPAWIDIASDTGPPTLGIIQVQGDQFQMCWTNPGGARPTEFTTSPTDGRWLGTFQRQPDPGEAENRAKCARNLRNIGQFLSAYASLHAGQLPPDFVPLLQPGQLPPATFICPDTGKALPKNLSQKQQAEWISTNSDYVYLGAGLRMNTISPSIVLAYDNDNNHGSAGANVLFGDGHVEFLSPAAEAKALEQSRHLRSAILK